MSMRGNRYNMPISRPEENSRSSPSIYSSYNMGNLGFIDQVQKITEQIDDVLGTISPPIRPYLPGIGRFLIVCTFLEDALRIISQWNEQLHYLWNMRSIPYYIAFLFLFINVICMIGGTISIVFRKRLEIGIGSLMFVIISQAIAYGLLFNFQFFSRNLSLIGGLLLALSDVFVRERRSLPGLPMIEDKDKSKYLQLAGRILLIFLFVSYMFSRKWSILGGLFNVFGLLCCILVVIGFKARFCACFLVCMLSIQNLMMNPYWKYHYNNPTRDYLRYEYFQTLSIVGGLILLVSSGAGKISIDEKKKIY